MHDNTINSINEKRLDKYPVGVYPKMYRIPLWGILHETTGYFCTIPKEVDNSIYFFTISKVNMERIEIWQMEIIQQKYLIT